MCGAGEFSESGLKPCSPCPQHHFAAGVGTTSCTECLPHQSTIGQGSIGEDECQGNRIYLLT